MLVFVICHIMFCETWNGRENPTPCLLFINNFSKRNHSQKCWWWQSCYAVVCVMCIIFMSIVKDMLLSASLAVMAEAVSNPERITKYAKVSKSCWSFECAGLPTCLPTTPTQWSPNWARQWQWRGVNLIWGESTKMPQREWQWWWWEEAILMWGEWIIMMGNPTVDDRFEQCSMSRSTSGSQSERSPGEGRKKGPTTSSVSVPPHLRTFKVTMSNQLWKPVLLGSQSHPFWDWWPASPNITVTDAAAIIGIIFIAPQAILSSRPRQASIEPTLSRVLIFFSANTSQCLYGIFDHSSYFLDPFPYSKITWYSQSSESWSPFQQWWRSRGQRVTSSRR